MSALIAEIEVESAEEFKMVFNNVARYVGLNVKARLHPWSNNKAKFHGTNVRKKDADFFKVYVTVDMGKNAPHRYLSDREKDLLIRGVDAAYGSDITEAGVGLWND